MNPVTPDNRDVEPQVLTAKAELSIGGSKIEFKLVVPTSDVPPEAILPALHELSNAIVQGVEEKAERCGEIISCQKGCGACCRQHVPISPAEARLLSDIIDNMPEPGRSMIITRFETAAQRLRESGMINRAVNYQDLSEDETNDMIRDYFKLGIACPFLEDESCSIHPFRPLVCREYLVVSPARYCAELDDENIRRLKFPVSVAETFSRMDGVQKKGHNFYIPLIMALEWIEDHPHDRQYKPGPKWVQEFFKDLSGAAIPEPELPPS